MASNYGKPWTDDETVLAYYYYCMIPFGQIHQNNPEIIRISQLLGRTPSSVVFKMGNLGHFDPELQKRNISGLKNASKKDAEIFERFSKDWAGLSFRAANIERHLSGEEEIPDELPVGEETIRPTKKRINQTFFRDAVLSAYQRKCCITGIDIPALLIASHIKPWRDSDPKTERTNPSNGLCLNPLHDKAFDGGLLTVLPDYTIRISSRLRSSEDNEGLRWLLRSDRQKIALPERFVPQKEFLEYHNDVVFKP